MSVYKKIPKNFRLSPMVLDTLEELQKELDFKSITHLLEECIMQQGFKHLSEEKRFEIFKKYFG